MAEQETESRLSESDEEQNQWPSSFQCLLLEEHELFKPALGMTENQHLGTEGTLSLHRTFPAPADDFFLSSDKWIKYEHELVF